MTIKTIIAAGLLLLCPLVYAQTCPTVKEIKAGQLSGWKAYDSDDNTALPKDREARFIKNAQEFALAEWRQIKGGSGIMHCYYRDKSGSDLEAYLASEDVIPMKQHSYWYPVTGFMHCAAGMGQCQFKHKGHTKRLADTGTPNQEG